MLTKNIDVLRVVSQTARLKIKGVLKIVNQTARLMVGIPDYENYVRHMREKHPDQTPMSYELFFRERQKASYGGGNGRCC